MIDDYNLKDVNVVCLLCVYKWRKTRRIKLIIEAVKVVGLRSNGFILIPVSTLLASTSNV